MCKKVERLIEADKMLKQQYIRDENSKSDMLLYGTLETTSSWCTKAFLGCEDTKISSSVKSADFHMVMQGYETGKQGWI